MYHSITKIPNIPISDGNMDAINVLLEIGYDLTSNNNEAIVMVLSSKQPHIVEYLYRSPNVDPDAQK
jgi:hypothetical protein